MSTRPVFRKPQSRRPVVSMKRPDIKLAKVIGRRNIAVHRDEMLVGIVRANVWHNHVYVALVEGTLVAKFPDVHIRAKPVDDVLMVTQGGLSRWRAGIRYRGARNPVCRSIPKAHQALEIHPVNGSHKFIANQSLIQIVLVFASVIDIEVSIRRQMIESVLLRVDPDHVKAGVLRILQLFVNGCGLGVAICRIIELRNIGWISCRKRAAPTLLIAKSAENVALGIRHKIINIGWIPAQETDVGGIGAGEAAGSREHSVAIAIIERPRPRAGLHRCEPQFPSIRGKIKSTNGIGRSRRRGEHNGNDRIFPRVRVSCHVGHRQFVNVITTEGRRVLGDSNDWRRGHRREANKEKERRILHGVKTWRR